jgi:hypothetical protein
MRPRSAFIFPRLALLSMRLRCELRVGFVAFLTFGNTATLLIIFLNRSNASSLFFSCVLYCCALITTFAYWSRVYGEVATW